MLSSGGGDPGSPVMIAEPLVLTSEQSFDQTAFLQSPAQISTEVMHSRPN